MANTLQIIETLAKDFPNPKSELVFASPFQLSVAVILSAQCTDKRVNSITPALFEVAPTAEKMAGLPLEKIESIIRPCGFYHSKAKYLKQMAQDVVNRFGGAVPNNLEDLRTLAGVGRKTANVVFAVAFGGQAIAVDTHVFRVSNRLGIANATNVLETEQQLMQAIPSHLWADSHHYILLHGRYVCKAQKPLCESCSVKNLCKHYSETHPSVAQPTFVQSESGKCLHCKNPQCKIGCPVGYDIPAFLQLVKENKFQQAVQTVGHLFGEVCGYICPRDKQCKGHCILNKKNNPVDVGRVERQVFAQAFPALQRQSTQLCGKKVAVVGGGVSGVTFAEQCFRFGAEVVIFEREQLLFTLKSIPSFRLPVDAVERIEREIKNNIQVVKKDVDNAFLQQLMKQFDIVYLATGVSVPHTMGIEGEQFALSADEFLRGNFAGKTVVVGGGNTAMDSARLSAKRGFETVVAYRRTRADMPAFDKEVEDAQADGVEFCFNLAPVSVSKNGSTLSVTFAKTFSEGRGKLIITDERVVVECCNLVVATGNGFDSKVFPAERFVQVDENNRVCQNLFAGGDATGKSLAVQAVADALNATRAIVNGNY